MYNHTHLHLHTHRPGRLSSAFADVFRSVTNLNVNGLRSIDNDCSFVRDANTCDGIVSLTDPRFPSNFYANQLESIRVAYSDFVDSTRIFAVGVAMTGDVSLNILETVKLIGPKNSISVRSNTDFFDLGLDFGL